MGDVAITFHTWLDDGDEDGYYEELRVDGDLAASGRPLDGAAVLEALRKRKGLLDGCLVEFKTEEGIPYE